MSLSGVGGSGLMLTRVKQSGTDPVEGSMMQPPSRGSFWQEQWRSAVSWLIPRL